MKRAIILIINDNMGTITYIPHLLIFHLTLLFSTSYQFCDVPCDGAIRNANTRDFNKLVEKMLNDRA